MWWLILLGAAAIGCTRSRDETSPPPVVTPPVPPVTVRSPLVPPDYYNRSPQFPSIPPLTPPVRSLPALNCSRFSTSISGALIPNARGVLQTLRQRVMPLLTPHVAEMQRGNFTAVQSDVALNTALASLNGLDILLSDGAPNIIDTLGDWDNLNAAMSYLNVLNTMQADPRNPNSQNARAIRAWNNDRMEIQFRGFKFFRSEIMQATQPHAESAQPISPEVVPNHFRIVTPTSYGNSASFPVLSRCNVQPDQYTLVDGF